MAGNKQRRANNNASAKDKKTTRAKQRPNDKCKCGSGKKFKHCCWRHAAAGGGAGGASGAGEADGAAGAAAAAGGGTLYDSLGEAELRRLAEAGDADAGYLLGQTLMARGEEAEAVKWVRWAAEEKGDAPAMLLLGNWYLEGKGVPQNELEGCKWARRASETSIEQGVNVEANKARLVLIGARICQLSGAGPTIDDDGLEALQRRAEAGDAEASCELGEALMARGEEAEAVKWVRWAAEEKGYAGAMYLLAYWYRQGKGVPQDKLEGCKWAHRAAKTFIEQGVDVEANKANLVIIDAQISQLTGGAVPSGDDDGQEAALRRRAEAGEAKAGYELGEALMERGEKAEAVKWVRWAAEEKAYAPAMGLLGRWYNEGKGVPKDELGGLKWGRRASETSIEQGFNVEANKALLVACDAQISQLTGGAVPSGDDGGPGEAELRRRAEVGDAEAGFELGQTLMARGEEAEAVKWTRWAAEEKAYAPAMGLLGNWYFEGKGVPKDKLEGCKWGRRACETCIELGVDVEANKALLVACDAHIRQLTGGAVPSGDDGGPGEAELRRRAEAGDAEAGFELGEALMMRGEEADAVKWARWAAEEKAYPPAMGLLADWYFAGKGVPQDTLEGYKWVRRAHETLIELGVNVEENKATLVEMDALISQLTGGAVPSGDDDGQEAVLRRRAEAGDAEAGWRLGKALMARGEEAEAVKWVRWAAEEKGYARAMLLLVTWYIEGKGVPQDELEGYKWAHRAAKTFIEQGVDVEENKARLATCDAHICQLSGGPDVSAANRAAVKKVKAALEEDPENESLASMLKGLKLVRVCDGCGASAEDEGVRLRVCTRCRQAFFCSQACLERSYERHKPDCTRLRAQRKARERAEAEQE